MLPIGEWAFANRMPADKEWIDAGLAVPLTLNLSAHAIARTPLPADVKRILDETGVPAPLLQLEMREARFGIRSCRKACWHK